jgi:penicillin amidase
MPAPLSPPRAPALVALVALLAAAAPRLGAQRAAAPPAAARPAAPRADTLRLAGLRAPVAVLRDSNGVAHIRAANEHDLFFAQGYNAARDRLFQLELWRRRATGTMAEALGARWVAHDRAARLLRFRGDAARELAWYHPRGADVVRAFCDGVNAYVTRTERDPRLLPFELRLLGMRPGRWTPAVVVSRHNALAGNAEQEVDLARAVGAMGAERVRRVLRLEPEPVVLAPDSALDLGALAGAAGDSAVAALRAYRSPPAFERDDLAPRPLRAAVAAAPEPDGSNNWAVAGRLTRSGRPLLANDPHRAVQLPSLRYWVHLTAPGWDVVGAGEPALPGVSVGHNRAGAWGLTVFGLDQEDLVVYPTDPRDGTRYRAGGRWESMRVERDTVAVRAGAGDVPVELRFTRDGPVLWQDSARHLAYALRAAWLDVGGAPYLASLRLGQARTWGEFRAAAAYHRMPAENLVWADTGGTIGWQAVGVAPVRRGWTGLLPVPGDGRYAWAGYLPVLRLPNETNPPGGVIATANEQNLPPGYPRPDAVARSWADPWRARRIREVLGAARDGGRRLAPADLAALQQDVVALPARALVPLLRGVAVEGALATRARDSLLAWDHALRPGSAAAGVYVAWERALVRRATERLVPEAARPYLRAVSLSRLVDWCVRPEEAPAGLFDGAAADGAPTRAAARDALLARTLTDAAVDLSRRLGPDPARWRYGQPGYKHALVRHPLSGLVDPAVRALLDAGPLPRGGYGNTVNATGAADAQAHGATFRLVADPSDWDASLGTSAPGQSGDPRSRHYRDLFAGWAAGRYFRVPFTAGAVERAAEGREVWVP